MLDNDVGELSTATRAEAEKLYKLPSVAAKTVPGRLPAGLTLY